MGERKDDFQEDTLESQDFARGLCAHMCTHASSLISRCVIHSKELPSGERLQFS